MVGAHDLASSIVISGCRKFEDYVGEERMKATHAGWLNADSNILPQ